jgi:hypothetical protein
MKIEFIRYMKYAGSIGKTKRHDQIFVESVSGGKGCFWDVIRPDLNLMIDGTKINFRENFSFG